MTYSITPSGSFQPVFKGTQFLENARFQHRSAKYGIMEIFIDKIVNV